MYKMKERREEKKISQKDLANKLGVTTRYIAFIEKGERTPSLGLACQIAHILQVNVEDIFLN